MSCQKFLKYCLLVGTIILGVFLGREIWFFLSHPQIPMIDNAFGSFVFFTPLVVLGVLRLGFRRKWVWVFYGIFICGFSWFWYFVYPAEVIILWVAFFQLLFFTLRVFRQKYWYVTSLVITGLEVVLFTFISVWQATSLM